MKKLIPALAVVTLLAMTAFASPDDENKNSRRRAARPDYASLIAKLELTPEQRTQIDEIQKTSRAQMAAFMEGTRAKADEIRAAHAAKDSARVAALEAELAEQRAEMKLLQDKEAEEMLNVLTAEQRTQVEKLKEERAERLRQQRKNVQQD
jgi:protein CpxP